MTRATDSGDGAWWLYVVRCADGTLYTGISPDVERRVAQHEAGDGARYLRGRQPLTLAGRARVGDRSVASRAEYRFKRLSRAEKQRWLRDVRGLVGFVDSVRVRPEDYESSLPAS